MLTSSLALYSSSLKAVNFGHVIIPVVELMAYIDYSEQVFSNQPMNNFLT